MSYTLYLRHKCGKIGENKYSLAGTILKHTVNLVVIYFIYFKTSYDLETNKFKHIIYFRLAFAIAINSFLVYHLFRYESVGR